MKVKPIWLLFSIVLIWFSGCAAWGVPYTFDPIKKLKYACSLFDYNERPLPAENLIHEAIGKKLRWLR